MKKYAKPFVPESSKILKDYIDKISPPMDFPIADIACDYGRNGAFLVDKGYSCIFCDIDEDSLNYIIQGKNVSINGDIDKSRIQAIQIDFNQEEWIFPPESLSGIINVHWYKKELIPLFSESVVRGGFIYIETITARGTNYLQLPEYGYIKKVLSNFKIIYCKEKLVNPVNENKATITILAEKNRTKV